MLPEYQFINAFFRAEIKSLNEATKNHIENNLTDKSLLFIFKSLSIITLFLIAPIIAIMILFNSKKTFFFSDSLIPSALLSFICIFVFHKFIDNYMAHIYLIIASLSLTFLSFISYLIFNIFFYQKSFQQYYQKVSIQRNNHFTPFFSQIANIPKSFSDTNVVFENKFYDYYRSLYIENEHLFILGDEIKNNTSFSPNDYYASCIVNNEKAIFINYSIKKLTDNEKIIFKEHVIHLLKRHNNDTSLLNKEMKKLFETFSTNIYKNYTFKQLLTLLVKK